MRNEAMESFPKIILSLDSGTKVSSFIRNLGPYSSFKTCSRLDKINNPFLVNN